MKTWPVCLISQQPIYTVKKISSQILSRSLVVIVAVVLIKMDVYKIPKLKERVKRLHCASSNSVLKNRPQGPVVQSWASTNSGLKFNPMSPFLYFYISVYFKTSQTKTTIDQDKISKEISRNAIK